MSTQSTIQNKEKIVDNTSIQNQLKELTKTKDENGKKRTVSLPAIISATVNHFLTNHQFVSTGNKGTLYYFNGVVWSDKGEDFVRKQARKLLVSINRWTNYAGREIVNDISLVCRGDIEMFNKQAYKVVLLNGTYDIKNNKFYKDKFFHEDYCTIQHPVHYDPDAKCPNIDKFLLDVMDKQDILGLFELVGMTLVKIQLYEINAVFYGLTGSGKTVLCNLLTAFLGEDNVSGLHPQDIDKNRFLLVNLMWKAANIATELPTETKISERAKSRDGKDRIYVEEKFKQGIYVRHFAKSFYTSNELPETKDNTSAFWRRWHIIDMNRQFIDKNNTRQKGYKDSDILLQEMTTPEERSGFLNHLIAGFKRLQQQNGEVTSRFTVVDRQKIYMERSSTVYNFISQFLYADRNGKIPKTEMYRVYKKVTANTGKRPESYEWFCKKFKSAVEKGLTENLGETESGGVSQWTGVQLGRELADGTIIGYEQLGVDRL